MVELVEETPRTRSLVLELPDWPGHRAGQHVDVRLTAEDGYQVERSYSIASGPEDAQLVLTVERLDDGEVSPYLVDRHRMASGSGVPLRLLYSSRSVTELIYRDELQKARVAEGIDVQVTLTREWPEDWSGHRGRIDRQLLEQLVWRPDERPLIYGCGPTALVESVANTLVAAGHDPGRIRLERFGPTGS